LSNFLRIKYMIFQGKGVLSLSSFVVVSFCIESAHNMLSNRDIESVIAIGIMI